MDDSPSKDPFTVELHAHCSSKVGAIEEYAWGHPVYKVKSKLFTGFDGDGKPVISVKAHPDEREGLLALPFIESAPYVGRYGWVKVSVKDKAGLKLAKELIDTSYELVTAKRSKKKPSA